VPALSQQFAKLAILRSPDDWKSEESATIYCRCRALPLVLNTLPINELHSSLDYLIQHVQTILSQLASGDRFALGEADPMIAPDKRDRWYPPNAFHTYWFLSILEILDQRSTSLHFKSTLLDLERAKQMQLWARSVAGRQISLHSADSPTLDSDQLAWSLAIFIRFGEDFESNLADQDFIRQGLSALFSKQTKAGIWAHGRPLFHYKYSGNAYCYIYETFTVLLKSVLHREKEGKFLRSSLRPYYDNLKRLWNYALETQIPLEHDNEKLSAGIRLIGWSSGHRVEDRRAESWATASVFSYAQALRRLIGIWTREEAFVDLSQKSTFVTAKKAIEMIVDRGATWTLPPSLTATVAEQLMTSFVNPVRRRGSYQTLEPDEAPIGEEQARSAILFGPPGTSKSNLARAVAGSIGWKYVELHASHFVAEGLPAVQRTADDLFQRLMELDHTVVLFDEIDELVRERDMEPDAFGRFLTTSMLPKLAELWNQQKIIYFIATNHIEYFDRAVTRARRFDALIFVTPPSFDKKIDKIEKLIRKTIPGVTFLNSVKENEVSNILDSVNCETRYASDALLEKELLLAKFIMLRWDQLEELVDHLLAPFSTNISTFSLTIELLKDALGKVRDPSLQNQKTYCDFKKAVKYAMKEFGKDTIWEVENLPPDTTYPEPLEVRNGKVWLLGRRPEMITAGQYTFLVKPGGRLLANTS